MLKPVSGKETKNGCECFLEPVAGNRNLEGNLPIVPQEGRVSRENLTYQRHRVLENWFPTNISKHQSRQGLSNPSILHPVRVVQLFCLKLHHLGIVLQLYPIPCIMNLLLGHCSDKVDGKKAMAST